HAGVARCLDPTWSPFALPGVVQCLTRAAELPSSLLERRESVALYSPARPAATSTPEPARANPHTRVTFAGCLQLYEHGSLHIVDPESGEHLRRLHI
ncbi:hypothetical protein IWQ56_004733, partial [Coemansia nantahalensis]